MRKLLFISDVIPDPEGTGSEQRAFSFLLAYSKFCDVEIWCHPRPDNPSVRRITKLADLVSDVFVYYPSLLNTSRTTKALFIESLQQAHAVHIIKLLIEIRHPRVIWDIDELPPQFKQAFTPIISENSAEELEPLVKKWVEFSKSCLLVACSSRLELSPLMSNMAIIPNCYSSEPKATRSVKSKILLFVGHLGYPPNVEAVDYFYKEIFSKLPNDYNFRIVGKKPTGRINQAVLDALAQDSRVEIHYNVTSCSPYYHDALAVVVPLLQGSGTRYKILEAFAHSCPIVSTSKGCEGYDVSNNEHLLICDDVESFAKACERLYHDEPLATRLVRAGLGFLNERHSQKALETTLLQKIRLLVPSLLE